MSVLVVVSMYSISEYYGVPESTQKAEEARAIHSQEEGGPQYVGYCLQQHSSNWSTSQYIRHLTPATQHTYELFPFVDLCTVH